RHRGGGSPGDLVAKEPCHLIIFDLLRLRGRDLTREPLSRRRAELEQLLADVPGTSRVVLGMQTADIDEARTWMESLAPLGIEGLVVKAANSRYSPGARGWAKVKHYTTTEALVGGVTGTLQQPVELILGRYFSTDDQLHVVARSTPLTPAAATDLAPLLSPG